MRTSEEDDEEDDSPILSPTPSTTYNDGTTAPMKMIFGSAQEEQN